MHTMLAYRLKGCDHQALILAEQLKKKPDSTLTDKAYYKLFANVTQYKKKITVYC